MIIDLTIENFKSFHEQATVRFASGTTSKLSGNLLRHKNGERFVKSMAIYGPNASGKTTVLDAIYALSAFVLSSGKDQKPTSRIPGFEPFALDKLATGMPSRIAITIELAVGRINLDVSATRDRVWTEVLTIQRLSKVPSRKAQAKVLIDRTWMPESGRYTVVLHDELGPELTRTAAIEQTTPNRLMLGKLASLNSELALRVFGWFDEDLSFYDMHRNPGSEDAVLAESAPLLKADETFAKIVARFLRDADTGIEDLAVVDEKTVEPVFSEVDSKIEIKEVTKPGLAFRHATKDGSNVSFPRQRESSGTLRFVALLAAILQPKPRRRLVCIDELSASMHPDLVRRLIKIVHSSEYNKLGSQILFTTHDTHLIDPGALLRRDQVTVCSKDRFGASRTVRLDEFQDSRSDANLQRQYLLGRFGGVPLFGPTLEDVPVDNDPLEVMT